MEEVLFLAFLLSVILNFFVCRHFAKQIVEKLSDLPSNTNFPQEETSIPTPNPKIGFRNNPEFLAGYSDRVFSKPEPNQVSETENDIEFDENIPMEVPPDVRIEVEGGDSNVPPGFDKDK